MPAAPQTAQCWSPLLPAEVAAAAPKLSWTGAALQAPALVWSSVSALARVLSWARASARALHSFRFQQVVPRPVAARVHHHRRRPVQVMVQGVEPARALLVSFLAQARSMLAGVPAEAAHMVLAPSSRRLPRAAACRRRKASRSTTRCTQRHQ
jgi:hypothetical protein